jgi:zinc protease
MISRKKMMLLLFVAGLGQAYAANVTQFQLDNGLTVMVKQDKRAPVVTSQVWYKIGASYEPDGVTGVSHMLEHMMFKGTKNLKPGELSKIIARLGGSENAFTSQDYTAYFQTIHKQHVRRMFELEAERMQYLVLRDDEFQKERKVVLEERRMRVEDQPNSRLQERFGAVAYDTNPYRRPVIGWQQDIENYQLSDLQSWYERHYAPNNAALVVVGDIEPEQVRLMVSESLAKVPARNLDSGKSITHLLPVGEKRLVMRDERAKVPSLLMGFAVPSWNSAADKSQAYALEMLVQVLDAGNSSRLSKELVRGAQQLSQVGAGYDLYARLPTQFVLSAVPAQGVSLAQAELALRQSIARIVDKGVSRDELKRVLAQVEASRVYQQDSLFYQGMKLGQAFTLGVPIEEIEHYITRLAQVTPEQVQQAAKDWLVTESMTVAYLEPINPPKVPAGGQRK